MASCCCRQCRRGSRRGSEAMENGDREALINLVSLAACTAFRIACITSSQMLFFCLDDRTRLSHFCIVQFIAWPVSPQQHLLHCMSAIASQAIEPTLQVVVDALHPTVAFEANLCTAATFQCMAKLCHQSWLQATDSFIQKVRKWKAAWPAASSNNISKQQQQLVMQELCHAHRDDIYRAFKEKQPATLGVSLPPAPVRILALPAGRSQRPAMQLRFVGTCGGGGGELRVPCSRRQV